MHKDWKTNTFYLENTRVTDTKRIDTLMILIAFAYTLCVLDVEGGRKKDAEEVVKSPKGKEHMVGLHQNFNSTILQGLENTGIHIVNNIRSNLPKKLRKRACRMSG
jgi:hypothetical protein